jgi:hypothetical protein
MAERDALQEARRQALLDAAAVLHSWLSDCNDVVIKHLSANSWAQAGMSDCIEEIEEMAAAV